MTREEAISILKTFRITGDKYHEAIEMAIKALEQESILDKIRAEILKPYEGFELGDGFRDGYNTAMVKVLNIINKYKSESENNT